MSKQIIMTHIELANFIKDENCPVLFFDTCSLLDIIRFPRLEIKDDEILFSISKILESISSSNDRFILVLPSVVKKEWCANFQEELSKTREFISRMEIVTNKLSNWLLERVNLILPAIEYKNVSLENKLFDMCQKIIDNSIIIEANDVIKSKAADRVIGCKPPAKKGKDSTKDCIIIEDILEVCNTAVNLGCQEMLFFVSSNKKEFNNTELKLEFDKSKLKYVTSVSFALNWIARNKQAINTGKGPL